MVWRPISLPNLIFKTDEAALPDMVGARLMDGFINEFGHIEKRPGLSLFKDMGVTTNIDGMYWWDKKGVAIVVLNGRIYRFTASDGTFSDVTGTDTLETSGRVSFAEGQDGSSNDLLAMANGGKIITYDNDVAPAYMADAQAPQTVSHLAAVDNYLVALTKDSAVFNWSTAGNILAWAALDIATAEFKRDFAVGIYSAFKELVIVGKESIESWITDADSGFVPMRTATMEIGCIAADSFIEKDGLFMWLDNNRRVVKVTGRTPVPVSGPFDKELRDITSITDARAMFIDIGTRAFYVINFPTDDKTYAYDLSTGKWAEWGTWSITTGAYTEFPCNEYCYSKTWNLHLLGDVSTGKIYKMDAAAYQDNGVVVRTLLRTGHVTHGTGNKKRSSGLRFRVKRGAGGTSDNEPMFKLRYRSDNKGWSNWKQLSLGKMGKTGFYIKTKRLGTYKSRQYEITHSENTPFNLISIEENIEVLRN